jgi:protein phosphatase 1 regulatory subunit 12A
LFFSEQDKENDIRNAQATQAVIQRRRRPKRRSTGVVHVDMDVRIYFLPLYL